MQTQKGPHASATPSSSAKRPKTKRKLFPDTGHSDANWIVSYADMMTLLCVFFILMFTLANPDPEKMEKLKKDTTHFFGGQYRIPYENIVEKLREVVKEKNLEKNVVVEADESGVKVTFMGTLFFNSGKAELLPEGLDILERMGEVAKEEAPGFKVVVEGHTDDVPIESQVYPSNWELSGARASRVIRKFETMGFDRSLLNAIGYADTRPVKPNRDPNGNAIPVNQAENRRVVLRLVKVNIGSTK